MPLCHRKSELTLLNQYCSDLVNCICPDRFSVFLIAWLLSLVLSAKSHWRSAKAQRHQARNIGLWGEGFPNGQGSERPQTFTLFHISFSHKDCNDDANILLFVSEWSYAYDHDVFMMMVMVMVIVMVVMMMKLYQIFYCLCLSEVTRVTSETLARISRARDLHWLPPTHQLVSRPIFLCWFNNISD